jgi:hypothetical protein
MILSASRRTDIPSYYSEWFINRLKEGYVLTRNPMNYHQIRNIELNPENIECIVFWTKDPLNLMKYLPQIDNMGYQYYFQFTLTPYGKQIERHIREKKELVTTFQELSHRIGRERVVWRYDPIILNRELTFQYHIECFENLCRELQGYTKVCEISFCDIYKKLSKEVKESVILPTSELQMQQITRELVAIGRKYDIELRACCEKEVLLEEGVRPAACIDRELIESICGHPIPAKLDRNQREGCTCIQSVDIGVYNTCMHGCVYCYANHSDKSILQNSLRHDPKAPLLLGDE